MSDSHERNIQHTISQEILNRISDSLKSPESKNEKASRVPSTPGSSFEVFRNNTTAVEVIVKEIPNKHKKIHRPSFDYKDSALRRLEEEVESLKIDLNRANFKLANTRKGFSDVVLELKKQVDMINRREMETQSKNLTLQLENEKLKTMLESKSRLLGKLKKEIMSIKHVLKFVMKGISCAPQIPEMINFSSDPEYDDFEKGLKRDCQVRFASNLYESQVAAGFTFDSTLSKDFNSFEKQ